MTTNEIDDLTFVHLSDSHIQPEGERMWNVVDGFARTVAAVDHVRQSALRPAFFIISGDLGQDGDYDESYLRLKGLVEKVEDDFQVPVLLSLGNHDEREPFRRIVLGEDGSQGDRRYYYSRTVAGIRVIVLDSCGRKQHYGDIDEEQLSWLQSELLREPQATNLLVVHHPPVPVAIPSMDADLLRNPEALAPIIRGHALLGIFCGHVHHVSMASFCGILTATTTGTAFSVDPHVHDRLRIMNGCGYNLVQVRCGRLLITPIELTDGQTEIKR